MKRETFAVRTDTLAKPARITLRRDFKTRSGVTVFKIKGDFYLCVIRLGGV